MLLRAARPQWRPALKLHPRTAAHYASTRPVLPLLRQFTTQRPLLNQVEKNKDDIPKNNKAEATSSVQSQQTASADTAKPKVEASNPKGLLSESEKAAKEQRKADWAIMREMAKYLWPKVPCLVSMGAICRGTNKVLLG